MSKKAEPKVFNLSDHVLSPEDLAARQRAEAEPQERVITPTIAHALRKRWAGFTKVPRWWDQGRYRFKSISTWRVALCVLHENWRKRGQPFLLRSVDLKARGISRQEKARALRELEALGLITIERRTRKNPVIMRVRCECVTLEPGTSPAEL